MYLLEIASFKSLLEIPCREKLANIVFIKKLLYDRKNSIATIDTKVLIIHYYASKSTQCLTRINELMTLLRLK